MGKIYSESICKPENEDTEKLFSILANTEKEAKSKLTNEEYDTWLYHFHNFVREKLNLPNKLFAFFTSPDETLAVIVLFPKEPDGNKYNHFIDIELKDFYIEV